MASCFMDGTLGLKDVEVAEGAVHVHAAHSAGNPLLLRSLQGSSVRTGDEHGDERPPDSAASES